MSRKNFKPFDLTARLIENGELFVESAFCAGEFGVRIGIRERRGTSAITRSINTTMTHDQAREFAAAILTAIKDPENDR